MPDRTPATRALAGLAVAMLLLAACSTSGDDQGPSTTGSGTAGLAELVQRLASGGTLAASGVDGDATSADPLPRRAMRSVPCRHPTEHSPAPVCSQLKVPEYRPEARSGTDGERVEPGETLRIAVARYPAWGDEVLDDPIVYLEGGPGVSALAAADETAAWLRALNEHRDLILFDQRGIGLSEPSLACPEVDRAFVELPASADRDEAFRAEREALLECRSRQRDKGIDASAYDTISAALDVAELRAAMGYDEWNVLGVSYGTRLAQTMIRERPEGIRSVILDSAYPLDDDPFFSVPRTGAAALDVLFEACRDAPSCDAAYPNLEKRYRAMISVLNRSPVELDFGFGEVAPVDGDDVVDASTQALYSAYSFVDIPRLVLEWEQGNLWALEAFVGGVPGGLGNGDDLGLFLSVHCRDEAAFEQPAAPLPEGELGGDDAGYQRDILGACKAWDVGRAPEVENEPVHGTVPTLVLAGRFDPITPPDHGRAVSDTFGASTFVQFPDRGHGSLGEACADEIASDFLAHPNRIPDVSCVAELEPPTFAPEDPGPLDLVEASIPAAGRSLRTLVPEGWVSQDDGSFLRDRSLLDYTGLALSADDRQMTEVLDDLLTDHDVRGSDANLSSEPIGDTTWTLLSFASLGDHLDIGLARLGGETVTVTLTSHPREREAVVRAIWRDILAGTTLR